MKNCVLKDIDLNDKNNIITINENIKNVCNFYTESMNDVLDAIYLQKNCIDNIMQKMINIENNIDTLKNDINTILENHTKVLNNIVTKI